MMMELIEDGKWASSDLNCDVSHIEPRPLIIPNIDPMRGTRIGPGKYQRAQSAVVHTRLRIDEFRGVKWAGTSNKGRIRKSSEKGKFATDEESENKGSCEGKSESQAPALSENASQYVNLQSGPETGLLPTLWASDTRARWYEMSGSHFSDISFGVPTSVCLS